MIKEYCFISLFPVLLFAGCSTSTPQKNPMSVHMEHCDFEKEIPVKAMQRERDLSQEEALLLESEYSPGTLHLARVTGIKSDLAKLAKIRRNADTNSKTDVVLRYHEAKDHTLERITMEAAVVQAFLGRLDCEIERVMIASEYLNRYNEKYNNQLTVWAIMVGGIVGTVTAVMQVSPIEQAIAVVGGVTSIGLSYSVFFINKTIEYKHETNLLESIYTGHRIGDSIPISVWLYLNSNAGYRGMSRSIRDELVSAWEDYGVLGEEGREENEALLFGTGGEYDAENLTRRIRMLQGLRARVGLMNQEFRVALSEISGDSLGKIARK